MWVIFASVPAFFSRNTPHWGFCILCLCLWILWIASSSLKVSKLFVLFQLTCDAVSVYLQLQKRRKSNLLPKRQRQTLHEMQKLTLTINCQSGSYWQPLFYPPCSAFLSFLSCLTCLVKNFDQRGTGTFEKILTVIENGATVNISNPSKSANS